MEQSLSRSIHVHHDAEAAALAVAARFVAIGEDAIDQRGRFCVALAGGSTPARMYARLAQLRDADLDWQRVNVFFSDERCVPAEHPGSNYGLVRRCLLDPLGVPAQHVHRIEGELAPPELAAQRYNDALRNFFGVDESSPAALLPEGPTFDLVLLGVGSDGHTASLFPGSPAVQERSRWAVHTEAPATVEHRDRVTLTLPVINAARRVLLLVTGENKSEVVRSLLAGRPASTWPAAMVRPVVGAEWHVDESALAMIHGACRSAPIS